MPFTSIFHEKDQCKDRGGCKVNKKNIKKVFKPDSGFKDKAIEASLFPLGTPKLCDCIIICNDDNIIIVEILCGKLTYKKFKEKSLQLENCHKVVQEYKLEKKVKKIILHYQTLENTNQNPQFRKKLINPKICGKNLELLSDKTIDVKC